MAPARQAPGQWRRPLESWRRRPIRLVCAPFKLQIILGRRLPVVVARVGQLVDSKLYLAPPWPGPRRVRPLAHLGHLGHWARQAQSRLATHALAPLIWLSHFCLSKQMGANNLTHSPDTRGINSSHERAPGPGRRPSVCAICITRRGHSNWPLGQF